MFLYFLVMLFVVLVTLAVMALSIASFVRTMIQGIIPENKVRSAEILTWAAATVVALVGGVGFLRKVGQFGSDLPVSFDGWLISIQNAVFAGLLGASAVLGVLLYSAFIFQVIRYRITYLSSTENEAS